MELNEFIKEVDHSFAFILQFLKNSKILKICQILLQKRLFSRVIHGEPFWRQKNCWILLQLSAFSRVIHRALHARAILPPKMIRKFIANPCVFTSFSKLKNIGNNLPSIGQQFDLICHPIVLFLVLLGFS